MRIDNFAGRRRAAAAQRAASPARATASRVKAQRFPMQRRSPPAASGYGVQLGAFSSAERANEEWKKLQADAAGLLDGLSPRVVVGEARGKTIYRLQAEVRDEVQARAICGGLKVAKKPCVPVIPHRWPLTEARQLLTLARVSCVTNVTRGVTSSRAPSIAFAQVIDFTGLDALARALLCPTP